LPTTLAIPAVMADEKRTEIFRLRLCIFSSPKMGLNIVSLLMKRRFVSHIASPMWDKLVDLDTNSVLIEMQHNSHI
jgi:hypothetical protein